MVWFIILILHFSIPFIILIILAVAFLTLFERKVLGSIQKRKGPNTVGFLGLLQPIADALKLLFKENAIPQNASTFLFFFGPFSLLVLSLSGWFVIPFSENTIVADLNVGLLYIFMISSLNSLSIIISGWASNSRYAFLGALRSIAQIIAYEVVIGIILINTLVLTGSLKLIDIVNAQKDIWFVFFLWFQFVLFFIAMLAETNRHPFDLAEAESELVSGYNVEHGSILFAAFSLAEYANILLLAHVGTLIFLGGWTLPDVPYISQFLVNFVENNNLNFVIPIYHTIIYILKVFLYLFLFIWVRGFLPRYRYDQLMYLGWKVFVPLTLGLFFISVSCMNLFDGYPFNEGFSYSIF